MRNDYYENEIAHLRRAFNEKELKLPVDPTIDRLIEGVAYLNSQLKCHLASDLADISETTIRHLAPEFLAPIPCYSLVEFKPKQHQLHREIVFNKGSELQTDQSIPFTLQSDLLIAPITINHLKYESIEGGKSQLSLEITIDMEANNFSKINFYLNSEYGQSCELYYFFMKKLSSIQYKDKNLQYEIETKHLVSSNLFSKPKLSIFERLKLYFSNPSLQFFLKIDTPKLSQHFTLIFNFNDRLSNKNIFNTNLIKLNIGILANLFEYSAEPISLAKRKIEYPLYIERNQQHLALHFIKKVVGTDVFMSAEEEYLPYGIGLSGPFYQLLTRESLGGEEEYFLSFSDSVSYQNRIISTDLIISNGYQAEFNMSENVVFHGDTIPSSVEVFSIRSAGHYHPVPNNKSKLWRLTGYLTFSLGSILDINNLKQLLHDCDWSRKRESDSKIESIIDIRYYNEHVIQKGIIYHCIKVEIIFDDSNFSSISEIFCFGEILFQLFLAFVHINHLVSLSINCVQSKEIIVWEPVIGRKIVL